MLYLYQSNRLENLAAMLAYALKQQPLTHPMRSEEILVQSQGMRRYINQYLAKENGIAANIHYQLPAGLSWRLIQEAVPNVPKLSPFSTEVMRWRLYALFTNPEALSNPELASVKTALSDYLSHGNRAAYSLAGQLADIFDQYLVYRSDWITNWQQGKNSHLGADEDWQAALWRYLDNQPNALHRVSQWESLIRSLPHLKLAERYIVFGISTLAPIYLTLLNAISQHKDVWIFALNPSEEHWGNILAPAQLLHLGQEDNATSVGHPLLASLGKQGRDFFDLLTENDIGNSIHAFESHPVAEAHSSPLDLFDNPTSHVRPSLLATLQHDIRHLSLSNTQSIEALSDGSIIIQSAHTPIRELQILKDEIRRLLAEHPDWQPHDIAVLTPSIAKYSPYISGIFGNHTANETPLPFSISDIKLNHRQPLMMALDSLLTLLDSRFEVDKLLAFLTQTPVMAKFELNEESINIIQSIISSLNIHWGLNHDMRLQYGADNNLFTWQQGIDRLLAGMMLPHTNPDSDGLWQNISPHHSNPALWQTLSTLSQIIYTLEAHYRLWRTPATVPEWTARIRQLFTDFFQPSEQDQASLQSLEQSLNHWVDEINTAHFDALLSADIVTTHLNHYLQSESEAGFLRGGITFCSMVPMRSLPFKMIALIGLNDGEFPRQTTHAPFDLIAQHPRKGDRARRDDDRYLFLEALISARECLYLSYQGHTATKNEPLAPSPLINELIDTLAAMMAPSADDKEHAINADTIWATVRHHPLQAFSRQYFTPDSTFTSTNSDYAEVYNAPATPPKPFLPAEQLYTLPQPIVDNIHTIDIADFFKFWNNPVRYWLQQQLGWRNLYTNRLPNAEEQFDSLNDSALNYRLLTAQKQNNESELFSVLQAESQLPSGEIGLLTYTALHQKLSDLDTDIITAPALNPQSIHLNLPAGQLQGSINTLHSSGNLFMPDWLNAPTKIHIMLSHLILSAAHIDFSATYIVDWQAAKLTGYTPIDANEAARQLNKWLIWYLHGQTFPLPFFPRTLIAAVNTQSPSPEKMLQTAYTTFYDNNHSSTPQVEDTEFGLIFGKNSLPDITQLPAFQELLFELLHPTFTAFQQAEIKKPN